MSQNLRANHDYGYDLKTSKIYSDIKMMLEEASVSSKHAALW